MVGVMVVSGSGVIAQAAQSSRPTHSHAKTAEKKTAAKKKTARQRKAKQQPEKIFSHCDQKDYASEAGLCC